MPSSQPPLPAADPVTCWGPAIVRNRSPDWRAGQRRDSRSRCPSRCPSVTCRSPVICSDHVSDLGGAMGIRTPDLLHAIHTPAIASCRPTSPGMALTCRDSRRARPGVAWRRATLAPKLAPMNSLTPLMFEPSNCPTGARHCGAMAGLDRAKVTAKMPCLISSARAGICSTRWPYPRKHPALLVRAGEACCACCLSPGES